MAAAKREGAVAEIGSHGVGCVADQQDWSALELLRRPTVVYAVHDQALWWGRFDDL